MIKQHINHKLKWEFITKGRCYIIDTKINMIDTKINDICLEYFNYMSFNL